MTNIETIQDIYAAFGRGDVPAILKHLAPDVELDTTFASPVTPWLQPRRGAEGFAEFFRALAEHTEMLAFRPKELLASGDVVVGLIDLELKVKKTGLVVKEIDEAHIWRFDAKGRVRSLRHGVDTYAHHRAFEARA